ncbi:hypothetical protein GCM10012279_48110 [Micromonospora yangpuensis]|uniref:Polyketide cyclase / dehydrase and lipid transport n=1 Tax=Micromonospora yangpuensis TaxID=683228 RepID=A0A1C6UUJ4_9ACTN|nr:hypothetical protein GCM10012279_48110 [Micromonospora yangpuensis]SCL57661.1 Polyketide cyclase / dehydrase and lipid transport [Micromonospora yangpuensis]
MAVDAVDPDVRVGQRAATLRYADGPSVTCEIHVETDPSKVWELVTDIHLQPRLSAELQHVEWLDGADRPVVGAAFLGHNTHPLLGRWRTASHVTECQPPRVFGWVVTDVDGRFAGSDDAADRSSPAATWRFELAPEAAGTRVRQSVRIGPGRSGLSLVIDRSPEREEEIVAARLDQLRAGMERTLQGIRALAKYPA